MCQICVGKNANALIVCIYTLLSASLHFQYHCKYNKRSNSIDRLGGVTRKIVGYSFTVSGNWFEHFFKFVENLLYANRYKIICLE